MPDEAGGLVDGSELIGEIQVAGIVGIIQDIDEKHQVELRNAWPGGRGS